MVKKKENKGMSLDDAFGDDDDVEYAESKPQKTTPKKEMKSKSTSSGDSPVKIKQSKPILELKKGDKIKINSLNLEVDANIILIEHDNDNEMALELFDPKTDKDYQLRYFPKRLKDSLEFYELDEIIYNKMDDVKKVEW